MKTSPIVALAAAVVLVGGIATVGVTAEINAQHDREDTVRAIVASVDSDATTSHINVRGRPLVFTDEDTVSTAYVDVTAGEEQMQWIIQDYRDNVIGLLDIIISVALPGGQGAQPTPLPAADGSYSNRGKAGDAEVTYDATQSDGVLTITADGNPVRTVKLPGIRSADDVHTYVDGSGPSVNLKVSNLSVKYS